jgi:hypothetical protein
MLPPHALLVGQAVGAEGAFASKDWQPEPGITQDNAGCHLFQAPTKCHVHSLQVALQMSYPEGFLETLLQMERLRPRLSQDYRRSYSELASHPGLETGSPAC